MTGIEIIKIILVAGVVVVVFMIIDFWRRLHSE